MCAVFGEFGRIGLIRRGIAVLGVVSGVGNSRGVFCRGLVSLRFLIFGLSIPAIVY